MRIDVLFFLFLERVQVLDAVSGSDSCVPNNPLSYKRSLDFKYKLAAFWEIPHPTCNRNLPPPPCDRHLDLQCCWPSALSQPAYLWRTPALLVCLHTHRPDLCLFRLC
ncbi:hypothetical protein GOODEAATRI_031272 [Goodea atripinnis]|uniref:Secreted protein n=1 Tax=Goodea atripinnis TaxID=208336 RepID=A0ABV0NZG0_9TELE